MADITAVAAAPQSTFDLSQPISSFSTRGNLILRRLGSLNVFAEMLPCTTKLADLDWTPVGIGPSFVYDEGVPVLNRLGIAIFDSRGIGYGCQFLAWLINDENVARGKARAYGDTDLAIHKVGSSNADPHRFGDMMNHFDKLVHLPEGSVTIARIQLHPGISHTNWGTDILANFAIKLCGARPTWEMGNFTEKEIIKIRKLVSDKPQIGAASGGVGSTVAARLMKEAIGNRFHAVLVDTAGQREHLGINLTIVDGADLFFSRLIGVVEREEKRKITGETFIDLLEREAIRIEEEAKENPLAGKVEWFLQGTLYADLIEPLSFKHQLLSIRIIPTAFTAHHNIGARLKLIEPLRELFKDEVRAFGLKLCIHEDLVMRHPFPGPGIAIRILGEVTPEHVELVGKVDHIFISMNKEADIYNQMSQAYAALNTNRGIAVRVMGDTRVYGMICILRAVNSVDFMSAEPFESPFQLPKKICRRIASEVDGIT
ncbi:GMP synthase [Ustulina deusta]|nr:GMP synthase [Ustulina deusta]